VPNNGAFAVDFNAVDLTSDVTVVLAAPETVNTLRFGDVDTASPAGWTITHNGSFANVLTLASPTITVNALGTGAAATIAANIAGSAGLVKLGAGKLQLTGTNTYTGNTTNGQGTLLGSTASIQGNLYLSNAVITVFNQAGGTGTFTGAIQDPASGTRPVLYVTNGSLTLAQAVVGAGGLDAYVDNATLNAQAIAGIGGQTLGLGWYSGPEVNSSFMAAGNFPGRVWFGSQGVNTLGSLNTSGSVTIANYVENRQNGSANPIYLYAAGGGTARVNNTVIQALNPLQQIVKIGPGNVRFGARGPASNNDRAYAGITVIRAGTLLVGANADGTTGALNPLNGGSLGYNNNTVQLGDGETLPSDTPALLLDGNNLLINHPISVNAYGASVTLGNNSGTTVTFNGDITLNTNVTLTAIGGSTVTFSKTLTEAGAGMALTKVGAGTVRLTTANSYSGGTLVSAGTLEVRADGGLGSGNVSVADGATLALSAGTANSYLGSTASLLLNGSAPVVRLNFTGTSTIHALSFDGGVTFAVAGTWGSPSSGAANTDARLVGGVNGEGLLEVLTGSAPLPPNFAAGGVTRLPDGNISLTASGAIGVAYRLWASTNVAATPIANTWTLLSSGTIAVSPFTLEDLEATNYTRRFYLFSAP
jgi:autotransporter-associated beta strand protein